MFTEALFIRAKAQNNLCPLQMFYVRDEECDSQIIFLHQVNEIPGFDP